MNVAVLGGGIAGLAAAHRLIKSGHRVTLYESSDRLGGLGTWFDYEGMRLDRFYHVILDSDQYLVDLLNEIGLGGHLKWSETTMGFIVRGRHFPFNTPFDLLRFKPLSLLGRVRTGAAALYITKILKDGTPLDDIPAKDWLIKLFGRKVYANVWEPLLIAKFGELRDRVPAYWIWNTLNREKNGSQEVKGYVQGGYAEITDRLADAIEAAGGELRIRTSVTAVSADDKGVTLTLDGVQQEYDALISTVPLPQLRRLADSSLAPRVPLPDLAYQGVANVMLILRERLERHYWTAVVDSDLPFQGIVETTHVLPPEWIGGRHIVYLMNYCSPQSREYQRGTEDQIDEAIAGLARLYPKFRRDSVEEGFVFKAPYVEPVWPRGYLEARPEARIDGTRVFLATTAQAYPMVTSWNTSVKLAEDAVNALRVESRILKLAGEPLAAAQAS